MYYPSKALFGNSSSRAPSLPPGGRLLSSFFRAVLIQKSKHFLGACFRFYLIRINILLFVLKLSLDDACSPFTRGAVRNCEDVLLLIRVNADSIFCNSINVSDIVDIDKEVILKSLIILCIELK